MSSKIQADLTENEGQDNGNHGSSTTIQESSPTTRREISIPIDEKSLFLQLPPYLEFRETEARRRGIYAKTPIEAGTTVLSIRPTIFTLYTEQIANYCSNCTVHAGKSPNPNRELKKCTGCKFVRYCGAECQSMDWPDHKPECAALRRWADMNDQEGGRAGVAPDECVRGMARLMWKRKRKGLDSVWAKQIDGMESHYVGEEDPFGVCDLWVKLIKYMRPRALEDLSSLLLSPKEDIIIILFAKFMANSLRLYDQTLFEIGICCSPLIVLFNHSCDLNITLQFYTTPLPETKGSETTTLKPAGLVADMVAFRDIGAGDELTISYTLTSDSTAQRRKTLERLYEFICKCPICEPQMHGRTDMDWRETLLCPNNCGGACPIPDSDEKFPAKCTMCGASSNVDPADLSQKREIGREALKLANKLDISENLEQGIAVARSAISLLEPFLTPCTEPLYDLCSLQQSMLDQTLPDSGPIPMEHYNELLRMGTLRVFAAQKIFRPGEPDRARALFCAGESLAKSLDTVDEKAPHTFKFDTHLRRLTEAKAILQQAAEEFQLGFGKRRDGGVFTPMVRKLLALVEDDLEELASYKKLKRDRAKIGVKVRV